MISRLTKRGERAQALVEFAFTIPVFALLVMVTIQLGLIFLAYYSQTQMARETARWVAVHTSTTDDTELATYVQTHMLPGLVGASTVSVTSPTAATLASATCHPTPPAAAPTTCQSVATVGRMTVRYSPCGPDANGLCAYSELPSGQWAANVTRRGRLTSETLYVEMQYDVGNLIFLPTNFRLGYLTVKIPTTLPAYRVSVLAE